MDNNNQQPVQPVQPVQQPNSTPILVFGILSLVFTSILGIIFGAIAKSKAKAWVAAGNPLTGKAKVGKILGTIGLAVGIVVTVAYGIVLAVYGPAVFQALQNL